LNFFVGQDRGGGALLPALDQVPAAGDNSAVGRDTILHPLDPAQFLLKEIMTTLDKEVKNKLRSNCGQLAV
jgi:hypothetical protein